MKRFSAALILFVTATWASAAEDAKEELKKLQGRWQVASAEIDGNLADGKKFGITGLIVTDAKLQFQNDGKDVMSFAFTADPSKKPKAMDWVKDKNSITLPTIYSLEGDELKLCMPLLPKKGSGDMVEIKRPESFDTKGNPVLTIVLKREKK